MEPTSERVLQDIMGWEAVIDKLIESRGCVVQGEALRSGKRARRADGVTDLATRLRNFQRKGTKSNRPVHPDALACFEQSMNGTLDVETVLSKVFEVMDDADVDEVIEETTSEPRTITKHLREEEADENPNDDDDETNQTEGGGDEDMEIDS